MLGGGLYEGFHCTRFYTSQINPGPVKHLNPTTGLEWSHDFHMSYGYNDHIVPQLLY